MKVLLHFGKTPLDFLSSLNKNSFELANFTPLDKAISMNHFRRHLNKNGPRSLVQRHSLPRDLGPWKLSQPWCNESISGVKLPVCITTVKFLKWNIFVRLKIRTDQNSLLHLHKKECLLWPLINAIKTFSKSFSLDLQINVIGRI